MRILHVIPSLSPRRGGPSFAIRVMAEATAQWGVDVHIVTTDDDGSERLAIPLEEPLITNSVTIRYFRRQTSFYTFSWPLTYWLWHHVHEYDILHIHSLFSYTTLPAAWFAHWHGIPYILRPLGHLNRWGIQNRRVNLKRLSLRWIEDPLLQRAKLLHFTCEQERIEAQEVGISSASSIVPLAIDTTPFQQLPPVDRFVASYPETQNTIRLLFLSRIDPIKGLELLLSAFAQLRQSHLDLVLVITGDGDAAYLAELKTLAQQLGIAEAIIWTGFLAGQAKLAVLAAADLFVLPSYSENFGIAVVEAMAASLPVVISDQVGIHHEVTHANAGLVTANKIEELVTAIHSLIIDSDKRKKLGSNGKTLVAETFSQAAMTQNLLAMYESVLADNLNSPHISSSSVKSIG